MSRARGADGPFSATCVQALDGNGDMAIDIHQLRPAERKGCAALWSENAGGEAATAPVPTAITMLSVVAENEGQLVGAVLCAQRGAVHEQRLVVAPSHRETTLARDLADKAARKLLGAGTTHCRFHLEQSAGGASLWDVIRWQPAEKMHAATDTSP